MKRFRILQEDFRESVIQRIHETHMQPTLRERICKFVSVVLNPGRDITNAVAMAYDLGVRRILRGASEEVQLAFSALVKESMASTLAPWWNKYAFLLGPTIVVPNVKKGRLVLEVILPNVCDVKPDLEDPSGVPAAACWAATGGDASFVMLDNQSWRYLDDKGRETKAASVHGLGFFPGAVFRLDHPIDGWWPRLWQERLTDATVTVAYVYSVMQWVRKAQNKRFFVLSGDTDDIPPGQLLDPELALMIPSRPGNTTTISVEDYNTSPQHFLDEIRFTIEQIIESYGIPQSAVTYDTTSEGGFMAASIQKEKLGHLREAQIPYLTRGEMELWPSAVAICRKAGHPLGGKLPPPDEIKEMLDIQWPTMRTIDDPVKREELYALKIKRGGTNPVDMLQEDNPHLTQAECETLMRDNLAKQAGLIEEFTKRNLVMDLSSGLVAGAEAMGKLGPIVRDAGKEPATGPTTVPDVAGSSE